MARDNGASLVRHRVRVLAGQGACGGSQVSSRECPNTLALLWSAYTFVFHNHQSARHFGSSISAFVLLEHNSVTFFLHAVMFFLCCCLVPLRPFSASPFSRSGHLLPLGWAHWSWWFACQSIYEDYEDIRLSHGREHGRCLDTLCHRPLPGRLAFRLPRLGKRCRNSERRQQQVLLSVFSSTSSLSIGMLGVG